MREGGEKVTKEEKRIQVLEGVIIDLTDAGLYKAYEIHGETGVSMERCKEMEEIIVEIRNRAGMS